MMNYTRFVEHEHTYSLCPECGALVGDESKHDYFHSQLDTTADRAWEAYRS